LNSSVSTASPELDRLHDPPRRIRRVRRLDDRAADDHDVRARPDGLRRGLGVDPSGDCKPNLHCLTHPPDHVHRRRAHHLLVDRGVNAHDRRAKLLRPPRALHRVGAADQVHLHQRVVVLPRLHALGDRLIRGAPSTVTTSAPALAATSTSVRPASMIFKSATIVCSGSAPQAREPPPSPRS
jgi:hypothetical protein